jgi:hypothetical protein
MFRQKVKENHIFISKSFYICYFVFGLILKSSLPASVFPVRGGGISLPDIVYHPLMVRRGWPKAG